MQRSLIGTGLLLFGVIVACAPNTDNEIAESEEAFAVELSATETVFLPNDNAIDAALPRSAPKGFLFAGGSGNRVTIDLVPDSPNGVSEVRLYGPQLGDGRWPSTFLARGTSRVQATLGSRGAYLAVAKGFGRLKAVLRGAVSSETISARLTGYVLGEAAADESTARASADRECRLWQDDMKRLVAVPGLPSAPTALKTTRCEPQRMSAGESFQFEAKPVAELAVPRPLGTPGEERLANVRGSVMADVYSAYQSWQRACQSAIR
jgi:hypothetical protein